MHDCRMFDVVLAICLVGTLLLPGCTTVFDSGTNVLRPDLYDANRILASLRAGGDLETAKRIFNSEPECVYENETNGLSWAHWYYTREREVWHIGFFEVVTTYYWNGVYAHCKFKDGILVGVILPDAKWGDEKSCVENDWVCQKYLIPKIQQHSDAMRGKAWYFNDVGHCYYYGDAGRIVDHWEGLNVFFKEEPVPPGYQRVWAKNSNGDNVYADVPIGSEYLGYYDDAFHYRSADDIAMAYAISQGLNNAVNAIQSNAGSAYRPVVNIPTTTTSTSSVSKKTKRREVKTIERPRCSAHDCELDGCGHCPVCKARGI